MGLTKKAKILLAGVATSLVLVAVVVPLLLASGKTSIETDGRNCLNNIDKSLQRSLGKMLNLVNQEAGAATRRVARDTYLPELSLMQNLVNQEAGAATRRVAKDTNLPELRDLEDSVNQLTRSLSDFAEMLNESGFTHIMSRFQQDLVKYDQLLTEILDNGQTISPVILDKIKLQENGFEKDETDLFNVEVITREQSAVAGPVILAIETASNKTQELLKVKPETSHETASIIQNNDTMLEISTNKTSTITTIVDNTTETQETQTITEIESVTESQDATITQAITETEAIIADEEDQTTEPIVNIDSGDISASEPIAEQEVLNNEEEPSAETEEDTEQEQTRQSNATGDTINEEIIIEPLKLELDMNHESDDETLFKTPLQTPDLSDVE